MRHNNDITPCHDRTAATTIGNSGVTRLSTTENGLGTRAGDDHDPSELGPDLTGCDREPIHIPGAIQPHGLLLVVDRASMTVMAGAGALEERLAPHWLGAPIDTLLGKDVRSALEGETGGGQTLAAVLRGSERFDVIAHAAGDRILIELEPAASKMWSASEVLGLLDAAGAAFERASDLKALCDSAAIAFREITGFDRVMIYRFLDDDAGTVIAEDRAPGQSAFLHHHFPASDIPRQARALYIRNRTRVIPDIHYAPAPLRPGPDWASLDLSDCGLRSVSPIHIQYLKNMGVGASASISIVKDGLLWGLIACHHASPLQLSHERRLVCRTLAGGLARQIRAKEDAELYRERLRLRSAEDSATAQLGDGRTLGAFLADKGAELCRMLGADGFVALQGADIYRAGKLPQDDDLREMAGWVRERSVAQPFASASLGKVFEAARRHATLASGLLAVTISTEVPIVLLWLRAEQIEVVNWAGNPHKAATFGADGMLTPRASFEDWSETVRGESRAWTRPEIETAARLQRTLFDARQNQRMRDLNRELSATIADREALLVQKDFLMKEVNHRVQNSLQLVSAFLGLQRRAIGDDAAGAQLGEAQRRLSAVALVHRRLYSDDKVETVDLARYIEDLCGELTASMDDGSQRIALDLAPVLMSADRAVNVGLILTELVINANKYAYGGAAGPVSVAIEQHRNRFRLIVADRGGGKTKTREGFGTRMLSAMVDRLSGTIEESDNRPGLRVIVTAPIEETAGSSAVE